MMRLLVVLSALLVLVKGFQPLASSARSRVVRLNNVGSDLLTRPDDENSKEYRDYLKKLMALQANRAKGGLAAPSSGSSDAYIAKLNRLKVEKMALEEAGIDTAALDTSYKPEDFEAAKYESQEPLVSASVLTGEAAIPGRNRGSANKLREMTAEELAAQKSAEEKVAAALARQGALPPSQQANQKAQDGRPIQELKIDDETEAIMNAFLDPGAVKVEDASQVAVPAKPTNAVKISKDFESYLEQQTRALGMNPPAAQNTPPPPPPPAAPQQSNADAQMEAQMRAQAVVDADNKAKAEALALKQEREAFLQEQAQREAEKQADALAQARAQQVQAQQITQQQVQDQAQQDAPVGTNVDGRLDKEQMQAAAEALQMLVKHRGGGKMGEGRLQGKEAQLLGKKLSSATGMMMKDAYYQAETRIDPLSERPGQYLQQNVGKAPPAQNNMPPPVPTGKPRKSSGTLPFSVDEVKALNNVDGNQKKKLPPLPKAPAPPIQQQQSRPPPPPVAAPAPVQQQGGNVQEMPIGLGTDNYLKDPGALNKGDLTGLRDGLIQVLAQLTQDIALRPEVEIKSTEANGAPTAAASMPDMSTAVAKESTQAAERIIQMTTSNVSNADTEKEIKLALSLLLKHRGGPGFGHGRLGGGELDLMADKLRNVAKSLLDEASRSSIDIQTIPTK